MAEALPTPAPSPPPPATWPSISAEINDATRKQHVELNRLITDRLKLALPPNASDPALLGQGLSAFAEIFYHFEATWSDIEAAEREASLETQEPNSSEILVRLADLRPAGLERSGRLRRDLEHIRARTGIELNGGSPQDMRLEAALPQKPHLLVAYAWVMYMAIFSGGRWIRQQLADAGAEFWTGEKQLNPSEKHGDQPAQMPGYSFLFFDSFEDGEDIKRTFKARLVGVEEALSMEERQEVVNEAQRLFEHCIALVQLLDRQAARQQIWKILVPASLLTVLLCIMLLLYVRVTT